MHEKLSRRSAANCNSLLSEGGEMAYRAICLGLLLSILPSAGCGTAVNLVEQRPGQGGVSPFGGVRQDVACLHKAANGELGFRTPPKSESEQHRQVALMLLWAADLPLTFIGDVVTWPYTVAYSCINQPVPVPPMKQAPPMPTPSATQAPAEDRPQTYPLEAPEPRKLP
jgi:hypothetical protein